MSSQSSRHAATAARRTSSNRTAQKKPPKRTTRPGGQPDGSSHMGAWGGWALAPNTADGRVFPLPHVIGRRGRAARSKPPADFLTFWERVFGTRTIARPDDWLR